MTNSSLDVLNGENYKNNRVRFLGDVAEQSAIAKSIDDCNFAFHESDSCEVMFIPTSILESIEVRRALTVNFSISPVALGDITALVVMNGSLYDDIHIDEIEKIAAATGSTIPMTTLGYVRTKDNDDSCEKGSLIIYTEHEETTLNNEQVEKILADDVLIHDAIIYILQMEGMNMPFAKKSFSSKAKLGDKDDLVCYCEQSLDCENSTLYIPSLKIKEIIPTVDYESKDDEISFITGMVMDRYGIDISEKTIMESYHDTDMDEYEPMSAIKNHNNISPRP